LTPAVARRALAVFLPLAALVAGGLLLVRQAERRAHGAELRASGQRLVVLGREIIEMRLVPVRADLRYLAAQPALRRWVEHQDPADRADVAEGYRVFAAHRRIYDQVRFLDVSGRERIRVDQTPDGAAVAPEQELRDEGGRPYVAGALALTAGQIYVAPFDLNLASEASEPPREPTVSFASPVFSSRGEPRGVVVSSLLGQRLLEQVVALGRGFPIDLWLVDRDGNWLLGPRSAAAPSFPQAHPEAWAVVRAGLPSDRERVVAEDGQLFVFSAVAVSAAARGVAMPGSPWILIAQASEAALAARRGALDRRLLEAAAALGLLLAVVSWLVARQWDARLAAQHATAASERRFGSLLESAPDAIVVSDLQGRIVLVNAQAERLFGYRRDELLDQPVERLVPARYQGGHVRHREGYLAKPHPRPLGEGLDLRALRKDGSEIPVAISLSPVASGDQTLIFSDVRDMTLTRQREHEIRGLNERLAVDNARLEGLNTELEAFSYSVSHDLRAPLRAIDGFSQALLEDVGERLGEEGHDQLARIRAAAQRMGQLIDDLTELSRITRAELAMAEVDLSRLAAEVAAELREEQPERLVSLAIEPGLAVRADARLLRVALRNLLANAWKFTAPLAEARVEVGAEEGGERRAYFVRDNGVGFDMQHATRLFRAFERLHDAREFPGTGIGLAIVQRVIYRHGGAIWAEARPGAGATFFFTLQGAR